MILRETVEQFAKRIGLSVYTVRKMCRDGKVFARRVGNRWQINVEASENGLSLIGGNGPEKEITMRRIREGRKMDY